MALVIVDYCKGNLASVQRGFEQAGYNAIISAQPADILKADAVVLPGVRAFADAAATLVETGQMDAIRQRVLGDGVPFLGLCLGMHLLLSDGVEGAPEGGSIAGLGLVPGSALRMEGSCSDGRQVKIPHMGWNSLDFEDCAPSPLFEGVPQGTYFYFTHSYMAVPASDDDVLARSTYARPFASAIGRGNIYGVQFHPEKSSAMGLRVLHNFGTIVYERS